MHELGITQGIIDRAREVAVANGAHKVTDLYLTMTPAADFTFDSIEMYFEMLTEEDDSLPGRPTPSPVVAGRGDLPELQRRVLDRGAASHLPAVRVGDRASRPERRRWCSSRTWASTRSRLSPSASGRRSGRRGRAPQRHHGRLAGDERGTGAPSSRGTT